MKIFSFLRIFKRYNSFKQHEYIKVRVYSESSSRRLYAIVTHIIGDTVYIEYVDKKKMSFLNETDGAFFFPNEFHYTYCCHLAYDEMAEAHKIFMEQ